MEKGYHNDRTPGGRPADFRSLDVYQLMLEYLEREEAVSHGFSANLRDQLDRAADSIQRARFEATATFGRLRGRHAVSLVLAIALRCYSSGSLHA